jgi:hypothetical protein
MNAPLKRIQRATEELNQLQAELGRRVMDFEKYTDQTTFLEEPGSLELLSALKATVDEMRRFLWFYIDRMAKQTGADANLAIQSYRIRRATEMLRTLTDQSSATRLQNLPGGQSFLEQVTAMVENCLQPTCGAENL